jgi:pimeloyl-ACP methyl ester carboxylesterase
VGRMDLAGHGESGKERTSYTSKLYADDIATVANALTAKNIILIGHSMSGAYVLEAALQVKNLKALIVVDTLKDLDLTFSPEQIDSFLNLYKNHFSHAVETILPQYLFGAETPLDVKERLQNEFLSQSSFAHDAIEPLYRMDLRASAQLVKVPVRAINTDINPTDKGVNQKYLSDYDFKEMKGAGHYPMIENPRIFNSLLSELLQSL